MVKQQYETKALTDNKVKVQLKTSECCGTIVKTLSEKCREFHTYKLKRRK
jgi:hypothetical protein